MLAVRRAGLRLASRVGGGVCDLRNAILPTRAAPHTRSASRDTLVDTAHAHASHEPAVTILGIRIREVLAAKAAPQAAFELGRSEVSV